MRWAKSLGPVLACVAAVAVLGAAHGWWTDRWGPSDRLQRAVAALDRLPLTVGDWVGEDVPFASQEVDRAGIQGYVCRKYKNVQTGEVVSTLLVCGRGGPVSVHTPDVCYTGSGYRSVSDESVKSIKVGEAEHSARSMRFAKPDGSTRSQLEVSWAWSADGRQWAGLDANKARYTLGRNPAVFKLYVVREFVPGGRSEAADPCGDFLRRALPEFATLASEG